MNLDKSFKKALQSAANPQLLLSNKKKNTRRKHRNSHLGCGTCKKRRIKCDENLPSCLNCLKGKLHCAYLNLDQNARNALRMAQYNQNLRSDKPEISDRNGTTPVNPITVTTIPPILSQQTSTQNSNTGNSPSNTSDKSQTPSPSSNVNSSNTNPNLNENIPVSTPVHSEKSPNATIVQTPYGPVVQAVPYHIPGMVYNMNGVPVPVQTVPQIVQVPLHLLQNVNGAPVPSVNFGSQQMAVGQAQSQAQVQALQAQAIQMQQIQQMQYVQQQNVATQASSSQSQQQEQQHHHHQIILPLSHTQQTGTLQQSGAPSQTFANTQENLQLPTIQTVSSSDNLTQSTPPQRLAPIVNTSTTSSTIPIGQQSNGISTLKGISAPENHTTMSHSTSNNSNNESSTERELPKIESIALKSESPEVPSVKSDESKSDEKVPISKLLS